ncbi:hypothetical protein OHA27_38830 [Streptomyces sp. NBC_01619]|uniref:hypothetical protein n=1 Tax=Streptomyces sp. NBC_01619 TaxID=2975901 RepID=UPI0022586FB3|nr:hypothetical protein [Streptomyces sp. NBC_01619]MCX4516046.1 hypothetical protein [Streptomyces sp. NBC_01619]
MPVYLTGRDADTHVQELEAPAVSDAADRAAFDAAHLVWPASAAAACAELACDLADADVIVQWRPDGLILPDLAAGPGDSAGIRVRTTRRAPHALYVITAAALAPLTHAVGALAFLQPFIGAAARSCDACGAEPGEPCLRDPSTT